MTKRETNLDLLRIVCMMMVVGLHFFNISHGGLIDGALETGSANWNIANLVYALCFVSVNCFVLISGYFQCTLKFRLEKLLSIWGQAFCYSIGIYGVLAVVSNTITPVTLVKYGMVVSQKIYWFVTAYFLMYAVSPFLNCAIRNMNRKKHLLCCIVLVGIFSVAHNLVYTCDFGNILGGSSFLWFCVLYMVAAYIRLYVPVVSKHKGRWLAVYGISASFIAIERFAAYWITPLLFGQVYLDSLFYSNNSILNTLASIALFMAFRSMEIKNSSLNRIVRFLSPLVFGVYLIHEHPAVRELLWGILKPAAFANSAWMLPYGLICVVSIFLGCILIEWVRQWVFRVLGVDGWINRISEKIQNRVDMWLHAQ